MKNDTLVSINNLSFSYNKHKVLDNISLNIYKGDYLGLIGPNGGGKTTFLKLLLNLLPLQSGSISLFGIPISQFKDWSKIGYVPQRLGQKETTFPATVYEIVSLGYFSKLNFFQQPANSEKNKQIQKAMEIADVWNIRHEMITQLSGGQQQRVFIAKSLVSKPELLILDEPTVGVDVETQEKFYNFLHHLNTVHNLTLVIVSHDIEVVVNEVNKVACLNKTLICDVPPKQFIQEDYFTQVYGKSRRLLLHNH